MTTRLSIAFWGTIARIGHLLQTREVRQLERQLHQQAMTMHNLYAQLIETTAKLREAEASLRKSGNQETDSGSDSCVPAFFSDQSVLDQQAA
jgi:septal ring factor EnvC (AmiA/AmiB activator)